MLDCAKCGKNPKRYIIADDGLAYCPKCIKTIDAEQYALYKNQSKSNRFQNGSAK